MLSSVSNISFKSTPLYNVKVKKQEGSSFKNVDAVFSKLDPEDEADIKAINGLKKDWGLSGFLGNIADDFNNGEYSDYYAVELKGKKPLSKRILSLCECYPYFGSEKIAFLQSMPKILRYEKNNYKGAGEVLLYGVIRESQKMKNRNVELFSADKAKDFYKHIGFKRGERIDPNIMVLPSDKFEAFISRVEDKYDFSSLNSKKGDNK